jgi:hypothetical protein
MLKTRRDFVQNFAGTSAAAALSTGFGLWGPTDGIHAVGPLDRLVPWKAIAVQKGLQRERRAGLQVLWREDVGCRCALGLTGAKN